MSILPEQNSGVKSALEYLDSNSHEPLVITLWTAILTTIFPSAQGFLVEPHLVLGDAGSSDVIPDFLVIRTEYAEGPGRRDLLVVECKRPSEDQPGRWPYHERQLISQAEVNRNASQNIYTAEAIGWRVKFFRWHGVRKIHEPLHPNPVNLRNGPDLQWVENILRQMKLSPI